MNKLSGPTAFYNKEIDNHELAHHLKIKKGDVSPYVLLPGDPKRCSYIAQYLENPVLVADYREYVTITGTYKGIPISICSTGIGGPSASIALEELIVAGAHTFIRVGTSGALNLNVSVGDIIIAQAAVRDEGTTDQYIPKEVPARAHYDVIIALKDSVQQLSYPFHIGLVHSKDTFYAEVEPEQSFFREKEEQKLQWYTKLGVLSSEMESAAIFAVGTLRKVRTGTILQVVEHSMLKTMNIHNNRTSSIDPIIKTALEALVLLATKDSKEMNNE